MALVIENAVDDHVSLVFIDYYCVMNVDDDKQQPVQCMVRLSRIDSYSYDDGVLQLQLNNVLDNID